jgi:hypothetical protein
MGNLLWENWNYRVYYKPLNTIVSHGQYLDVSLNKSCSFVVINNKIYLN